MTESEILKQEIERLKKEASVLKIELDTLLQFVRSVPNEKVYIPDTVIRMLQNKKFKL